MKCGWFLGGVLLTATVGAELRYEVAQTAIGDIGRWWEARQARIAAEEAEKAEKKRNTLAEAEARVAKYRSDEGARHAYLKEVRESLFRERMEKSNEKVPTHEPKLTEWKTSWTALNARIAAVVVEIEQSKIRTLSAEIAQLEADLPRSLEFDKTRDRLTLLRSNRADIEVDCYEGLFADLAITREKVQVLLASPGPWKVEQLK